MKTLTMILASAGLAAVLSAPAAWAGPAPAGHDTACSGPNCKTHGKHADHKKAAHKSGHKAGHKTAHKTTHSGKHHSKDCKAGQDCHRH